jgi:hypothetical protein
MNEWVWSVGGKILTGETEVLGEKYTASVVDEWMSVEHWWNDIDRENWSTERTRVKVPFSPPQIHMDWSGIEYGPLRRDAGDHLSHNTTEQHSWFLKVVLILCHVVIGETLDKVLTNFFVEGTAQNGRILPSFTIGATVEVFLYQEPQYGPMKGFIRLHCCAIPLVCFVSLALFRR